MNTSQNGYDQRADVRADRPTQSISREGVHSRCARWEAGRLLVQRAVVVLDVASRMARHAPALMEELDGASRCPTPQRLADQGVRGTVEVLLEGGVVVDVELDLLPLGVLVGRGRKRLQRRRSSRS